MFPSCIRILAQEQPIGSITEKDNYYASIANHQYLIRYVIKVDIQRRFGNVQGIQQYRFYLFQLCIRIIADVPTIYSVVEKEKHGFTNMEPVG